MELITIYAESEGLKSHTPSSKLSEQPIQKEPHQHQLSKLDEESQKQRVNTGIGDGRISTLIREGAGCEDEDGDGDGEEKEEGLSFFEKYLALWVLICMGIGIGLSQVANGASKEIESWKVGNVSIPIGVCLFLMMYPALLHLDLKKVVQVMKQPKPILSALFGNWVVAPVLAWGFSNIILKGEPDLIFAGILLGSSPCTAMVLVWGRLAKADQEQNFINTSVNVIMLIVLYAPVVRLFTGISHVEVGWNELLISSFVFIGTPIIAGIATRLIIQKFNKQDWLMNQFRPFLGALSIASLLLTLIILFWMNGDLIVTYPKDLLLMTAVLFVQYPILLGLNIFIAKFLKLDYKSAATSIIIASSSNFEVALATAITSRGVDSKAALGTTMGLFWEVPLMLLLVFFLLFSKKKAFFSTKKQI